MQLSEHFTYKKLFKYSFPSIAMMIFTSIYGVVDGFFISNFVGTREFTAVNFILPVVMILGAIGFVFGTGGAALIGKTLGENNNERANEIFSLLIYTSIVAGAFLTVVGIFMIKPVASFLGAEGQLLKNSIIYGSVYSLGVCGSILQFEFQCLMPTAQKPKLGLYVTIAAGMTNIILDALFVAVFKWGLIGAAAATAVSQWVGGIIPLIYFSNENDSLLKLTKTRFDIKVLIQTCFNGLSELLSNIATSIVGILFNMQLLKYAGENGVAAYGVMMYVSFIFVAIYWGYTVGTSPIISYNFGAQNFEELKSLRRKNTTVIVMLSIAMFTMAVLFARPVSAIFVKNDYRLLEMTIDGFSIFSFSFLFSGLAIFGSSFFTALNDGFVSALLAILRSFVFQIGAVLILPLMFDLDGIWLSVVVSDALSMTAAIIFIMLKKKKYKY